jgi:exonuclease SbcC
VKILKEAEERIKEVKQEQKTAAVLIQEIRLLDQQLSEQNKEVAAAKWKFQEVSSQISKHRKLLEQNRLQLATTRNDAEAIRKYQSAHPQDEILITQLTGITEQINNLQTTATDIDVKEKVLNKAMQALKKADQSLNLCKQKLTDQIKEYKTTDSRLEQKRTELKNLLGNRLLREYRTEKDTLLKEMVFLQQINELESLRKQLEDGKPCPLCGAKVHPFAAANVPRISRTEKEVDRLTKLIEQAEQLENSIKQLETDEKGGTRVVNDRERVVTEARNEQKNLALKVAEVNRELKLLKQRFTQLETVLLNQLKPFKINEIPAENPARLLTGLKERCRKWQKLQTEKMEIEKRADDINSEVRKLEALLAAFIADADKKESELGKRKKYYRAQLNRRQELFGDKKPDLEEARLEHAVAAAEQAEQKARQDLEQTRQLLAATQGRIKTLAEGIAKRSPELQILEAQFITNLQKSGFDDESAFLKLRLPTEQRNQLSLQAQKLDDSRADIQARKSDREQRLEKKLSQKVTDIPPAELQSQQHELSETLRQMRDDIGGLKQKLADNQQARERIKEKQTLIEAQKHECQKWEKLHSLIGSADGKKYRNFAQGLTFELMVAHANLQLEKMSDRYLLLRDEREPLELNVADNYQAGEIRSTKNLSGGESFIVSLALALGLSKMASRKVRIDSLFLDEGFGSLDEDTLDTALETLSGLHQNGKLIGIISHVPALKERISTQINIAPKAGGRSTISGPGCRQVI